ncbi:MAG: substrate-binding domain-containing protein [Tannerellaceae bacterium]|nr:substrate-binding domain-containing protein [Tannerellaceae bacterium]
MKRFTLIISSILFVLVIYTSCEEEEEKIYSKIIEGLTLDTYPRVDGSTSAGPLNIVIACELLGIDYKWVKGDGELWKIEPAWKSKGHSQTFTELIKISGTHQSCINLIDRETDLILSARKLSSDEKKYADSKEVSLIETPIALDAFVFITHHNNPIKSLTIKQIQDIYTEKITHWSEVGGNNVPIHPYVREPNSGSQELMDLLVMKDLDMGQHPVSWEVVFTMTGAFERVQSDENGICYTVYYYKENIFKEAQVKSIAIEGIYPEKESISNNSYPLNAEVYAIIRSDLDKSSMAYKIYELLQTKTGKEIIRKSGYIPN